MPTDRQVGTQTVVYPYERALCLEEEGNSDIFNNMNEPKDLLSETRQSHKETGNMTLLTGGIEESQLKDAERKTVVAGAKGMSNE